MKGVAESGDELAAKDAAEHADGQEEGALGRDPTGMIRSETAGGKYAVHMRMKLQALIPTVEHAEETDVGSKMPWIASDLKQRLSARLKEKVVDESLVLQRERGQFPRQSEDGVNVASGQQFPFARLEPAPARVALARGQWRFLHELYEMAVVCPQPVQRSRCPPARRCGSA